MRVTIIVAKCNELFSRECYPPCMIENAEPDVNNTAEDELVEDLLDDVSGGAAVITFIKL